MDPAVTNVTAEGAARLIGGTAPPVIGSAGPLLVIAAGALVLIMSLWLDRYRLRRAFGTQTDAPGEAASLAHVPLTTPGILGMATASVIVITGVILWSAT